MRHEEITIIGGGWSVTQVDLTKVRGYVIGINDSALRAPRIDACLSMDRLWTEWRWSDLKKSELKLYIRRSALKNIKITKEVDLLIFENDHRTCQPSSDFNILNGDNSGACALNLALHFKPKIIWLLGLDMARGPRNEPYWYPSYPWRPNGGTKPGHYKNWARNMAPLAQALDQNCIAVYNVSSISTLPYFRKVLPTDFNAMV